MSRSRRRLLRRNLTHRAMLPRPGDMGFTTFPGSGFKDTAELCNRSPWIMRSLKAASLATAALLLLAGCGALKRLNNSNMDGSMIRWDPVNGLEGTIKIPPEPAPPPPPPPAPLPEASADRKDFYEVALEK